MKECIFLPRSSCIFKWSKSRVNIQNVTLGLTYVCHMTESKTDTNRCTYSCKIKFVLKQTEKKSYLRHSKQSKDSDPQPFQLHRLAAAVTEWWQKEGIVWCAFCYLQKWSFTYLRAHPLLAWPSSQQATNWYWAADWGLGTPGLGSN